MVRQSSKANGEQQRPPGFLNLAAQPVQAERAQPCRGMGILTCRCLQAGEDLKGPGPKYFFSSLNLGCIIKGCKGLSRIKGQVRHKNLACIKQICPSYT